MDDDQKDLFEPDYLTYRPSSAIETRAYVTERLKPIADELRRAGANPLAVAQAFYFFHSEFQKEAEQQILEAE